MIKLLKEITIIDVLVVIFMIMVVGLGYIFGMI